MKYTLKIDLTLKTGETYKAGSQVTLVFVDGDGCKVQIHGLRSEPITTSASKLDKIVKGIKKPSLATLEKWLHDGIARSVTGSKCEPDGYDEGNSPSWLLVLGFI